MDGRTKQKTIQKEERLGEKKINTLGIEMEICEYNSYGDIWVMFEKNPLLKVHTSYSRFKEGKVSHPHIKNINHELTDKHKEERLGKTVKNNQGCEMTIIEYFNERNITIQFKDKRKTILKNIRYSNFLSGSVRNPFYPVLYNVGYTGDKYLTKVNGSHLKEYSVWEKVLQRCFDEELKKKYPTYEKCTICEEWLCYSNFVDWCHEQENYNKWNVNDRTWNIDKDICKKGNKLYSPETCFLVPQYINVLFCKSEAVRGTEPIGVSWSNSHLKYQAYCNTYYNTKRKKCLGFYDNFEEAFIVYKDFKEKQIKTEAELAYKKGEITKKCYEAMIKYKVEITD